MAKLTLLPLIVLALSSIANAASCRIDSSGRKECGFFGITREQCLERGCCWGENGASGVPWCYRTNELCSIYKVVAISQSVDSVSAKIELDASRCVVDPESVTQLQLDAFIADDLIHLKIIDALHTRWEIPSYLVPSPFTNHTSVLKPAEFSESDRFYVLQSPKMILKIQYSPFNFAIIRKSDNEVLFDTNHPDSEWNSIIYDRQFLQISSKLPKNAHLYGFGERAHPFRLDSKNSRLAFFARDTVTSRGQNVYGVHPVFVELRSGKSHGAVLIQFLRNSNGMDVVLSDGRITYKVIGGILDFYFLSGPSPNQVIQQYWSVIGRPVFIPRWSLGFHQCRYGYKNIAEVKQVVEKFRENDIPLESMWIDIDHMDNYMDFTFDPVNFPLAEIQKFTDFLKQNKQRFVLIIDPAIKILPGYEAHDLGVLKDVFVKNTQGKYVVGKVWPDLTYFPDFFNPRSNEYWATLIQRFVNDTRIDGLWLDMNEVSNFCHGDCTQPPNLNSLNFPPYKINNGLDESPLYFKTIPMDSVYHGNILEYNAHNLYGLAETISTHKAFLSVQNKRPFFLSRSTFPGSGQYTGHWTGDNISTWDQMYLSIPQMLNFQIFGIPMVGADICGFVDNSNMELCARWMALGSFYPFSRNHNAIHMNPQEPYIWPEVAKISKKFLYLRNSLISYWYTLFYHAHTSGCPVLHSIPFLFPQIEETYYLDKQFFVGEGLLVSPVLEEKARSVRAYFPPGIWYDFFTNEVIKVSNGHWIHLQAELDHVPLHIGGGNIIPIQKPLYSVTDTVMQNFSAIIALDEGLAAKGNIFIDDGESFLSNNYSSIELKASFHPNSYLIHISGSFNFTSTNFIQEFKVLGWNHVPKKILVDGIEQITAKFSSISHLNFPVGFSVESINVSLNRESRIEFLYDDHGSLNLMK